jgi:hypothetical protein
VHWNRPQQLHSMSIPTHYSRIRPFDAIQPKLLTASLSKQYLEW